MSMSPPDENSHTAAMNQAAGFLVNTNGQRANTADNNRNESASSAQSSTTTTTATTRTTTTTTTTTLDESPHYIFLTQHAARQLPHYKYQGEDRSLLYKYILSPWASFCVHRLTPTWLAPNTITLIGLVFMTASYGIFWYYDPLLLLPPLLLNTNEQNENANNSGSNNTTITTEGEHQLPRWIFLYNAVAILIYQTLDNMDGKQARRTGSSSPLGLLFDHGCDAVNSLFGSANWIISMALHNMHGRSDCLLLAWIIVMGPYGLFYVGTWEEYYTGSLILPLMNGPNEGLLGAALMSLTSWYYGPAVWQQCTVWDEWIRPVVAASLSCRAVPFWNASSSSSSSSSSCVLLQDCSLRNADILILLSTIGFVQEIGIKTFTTARRFGGHVLLTLIPFVTLLVTSLAVDANVWLRVPRTSLHLCATLFCDMTTDLMLAHITKQPFQYFRLILLPLLVLTALVVSGYWSAGPTTDLYLVVYTTAAFTFFVMKSVIVIQEVAHVLQIWCFDIVTPRAGNEGGESSSSKLLAHAKKRD